jgi:anthranilate synthase/aminodeoxychorismate synthase-like glutamine amidotransferase
MIFVLDNYDSFTFNLVHLLRAGGEDVQVVRCDRIPVDAVMGLRPRGIVISPGPGQAEERGIAILLIRRAAGVVPVLGTCLGHQAIALAFGGRVTAAPRPVHGKVSLVRHDGKGLFFGLPDPFPAMRYHSLVVERASIPSELEVSAWLDDPPHLVMGLRHRHFDIEGVQFHPESFMTPDGRRIIENFFARSAVHQT